MTPAVPETRAAAPASASIPGPIASVPAPPAAPTLRSLRRTFIILVAATLAVFGLLVLALTAAFRPRPRTDVLHREAGSIHAVATMQISSIQARLARVGLPLSPDDVFTAVLESSRLRGVLSVQLFDATGRLHDALPPTAAEIKDSPWWPTPLPTPVARFHPHQTLEHALGLTPEPDGEAISMPLLEVVVPLTTGRVGEPLGVARYWLDGTPVRDELRRLDRNLLAQAAVAFGGGGLLIVVLLAWAFRRLAQAQRELIQRSADLQRANQELDFAAKTGALGAISAHLIHGLKNPLAGLEGFVAEATAAPGDAAYTQAGQTAVETARRLRALVNEVVALLRDEAAGAADYAVPLDEAMAAVRARAEPLAASAGVALEVTPTDGPPLRARTANLAGLVLANLLTNAIQASPRGGAVRLEATRREGQVVFLVQDHGPGLPPHVRESLFRPVQSTKSGGGGMGLAISHRLARHLGGELACVRTDAAGTVFQLVVPTA